MELRLTNKKIRHALIISVFVSLLFFGVYSRDKKSLEGGLLSPGEFHLIYVAPILSFLASYFAVCWFVFRDADKPLIQQLK